MTNEAFADELVARLNDLAQDATVSTILCWLIEKRIPAFGIGDHPTIQTKNGTVGLLGVLNGLCGVIHGGPKDGCGLITSVQDEHGGLSFRRTDEV